MKKPLLSLTIKEKAVLEYIESCFLSSGICPSFQEIKEHFSFASFNSVQNYIKQLQAKGYITYSPHQKRAIQILQSSNIIKDNLSNRFSTEIRPPSNSILLRAKEVLSLPLLGKVAAGKPIESLSHNEEIFVSPDLVKKPKNTFALKVSGDSMIEDGIHDGDVILVQEQEHAHSGEMIVATIDNEATVKRIYFNNSKIELRPSNSLLKSMWFPSESVKIRGKVIALIRKL